MRHATPVLCTSPIIEAIFARVNAALMDREEGAEGLVNAENLYYVKGEGGEKEAT